MVNNKKPKKRAPTKNDFITFQAKIYRENPHLTSEEATSKAIELREEYLNSVPGQLTFRQIHEFKGLNPTISVIRTNSKTNTVKRATEEIINDAFEAIGILLNETVVKKTVSKIYDQVMGPRLTREKYDEIIKLSKILIETGLGYGQIFNRISTEKQICPTEIVL